MTELEQRLKDAMAMQEAAMQVLSTLPKPTKEEADEMHSSMVQQIAALADAQGVDCGIILYKTSDPKSFNIAGKVFGNVRSLTALEMLIASKLEIARVTEQMDAIETKH